jgi:hypothetical protein
MDKLVEGPAREELVEKVRAEAAKLREVGEEEEVLDFHDDSVRSNARTDLPVPTPPFWGVRELEVDLDEVYPHLDTHVLFKLHWGGRGVKGEEWKKLVAEDFRPRLERMWREQTYLHPRALLGYFPCYSEGNEIVVLDPEDRETELERLYTPRQAKGDRIALADFFRPKDSGELDVDRSAGGHRRRRGHRGHGQARAGRRVRRAALHPRHRRPDRRGHGRVAALEDPRGPRHPGHPGPPLLVGLPRRAEQSEHEKVDRLLGLSDIGIRLSGGHAVESRAVHARADLPTTRRRLLRHAQRPPARDGSPDDVIKGSPRDPSRFARSPTTSRPSPAPQSPAPRHDPSRAIGAGGFVLVRAVAARSTESAAALEGRAGALAALRPAFVAITYGAGRPPRASARTTGGARTAGTELLPLAHLTCAAHVPRARLGRSVAYLAGRDAAALHGDPAAASTPRRRRPALRDRVGAAGARARLRLVGVAVHPRATVAPLARRGPAWQAAKLRGRGLRADPVPPPRRDYFALRRDACRGVGRARRPRASCRSPTSASSSGWRAMSGTRCRSELAEPGCTRRRPPGRGAPDRRRARHGLCRDLLRRGAPRAALLHDERRARATLEVCANLGCGAVAPR